MKHPWHTFVIVAVFTAFAFYCQVRFEHIASESRALAVEAKEIARAASSQIEKNAEIAKENARLLAETKATAEKQLEMIRLLEKVGKPE